MTKLKRKLKEIEKGGGKTFPPYMVSITFKDKPGYENIDCETWEETVKVASRKDIFGICTFDARGSQLVNGYVGVTL